MLEILLILALIIINLIILLLSILRFGQVNHGEYNISHEHQKRLENAHDRYIKKSMRSGFTNPVGKPLYKAAMFSHYGLSIYREGIIAKFCVGSIGKYKFKRFEHISGIFPVILDTPASATDLMMYGVKSQEGLQIETVDYEVFVIDPTKHDMETLIPILKHGIGKPWDEVYKEREILVNSDSSYEVGWHAFLRTASAKKKKILEKKRKTKTRPELEKSTPEHELTEPRKEYVGGEGYGIEILSVHNKEKGALLTEESASIVEKRKRNYRRVGVSRLILGVVILFASIFYFTVTPLDDTCLLVMGLLLFGIGLLSITHGVKLYQMANFTTPQKIYQNGISINLGSTGEEVFVPYGQFKNITEIKNNYFGDCYQLISKDLRFTTNLSKEIKDIELHIDHIRTHIGKFELDYPVETSKIQHMIGKLEILSHIIMWLISISISVYVVNSSFGEADQYIMILTFGFFFPMFAITSSFIVGFVFISFRRRQKMKNGINLKFIGVTFIVMLLIFFSSSYLLSQEIINEMNISISQDEMPNNREQLTTFINNSDIELNNNLVLRNFETLKLYNSNITFNCKTRKEYSIWLAEYSNLELINCTLQPYDSDLGFGFEIYGSVSMENCTIRNVWGDPDKPNLDGGIEIYSDSVKIIDCQILNGKTNGVLIYECSPVITGNVFSGFPDDAIELYHSNAIITENLIVNSEWGMIVVSNSAPIIRGNIFRENSYAISIASSDPRIEENSFKKNSGYAIQYDSNSDPVIKNNNFEDNEEDIQEPSIFEEYLFVICGSIMIIFSIVFFALLLHLQVKNFRKKTSPELNSKNTEK